MDIHHRKYWADEEILPETELYLEVEDDISDSSHRQQMYILADSSHGLTDVSPSMRACE